MNDFGSTRSVVAVAYPISLFLMVVAVTSNLAIAATSGPQRLPSTFAVSVVAIVVGAVLAWRTRSGRSPTPGEARFVAVFAFALVLIGFALNGPEATLLAPLGMVAAYALAPARTARWLALGYVAAAAVAVVGFEQPALFARSLLALLALWPLTDRIERAFLHQSEALRTAAGSLERENDRLGEAVEASARSLLRSRDALITAMSSLAAQRSLELAGHAERVEGFMRHLAEAYHARHGAARGLSDAWVDDVVRAAPLHDIGKLGVPEALLAKVEPLTPDEVAVIQGHCRIGRDVIDQVIDRAEPGTPYLAIARDLVVGHHEHWDGTGYPDGLAGEAIPLPARLMAVVDVYDALTSERAYKAAIRPEEALDAIRAGRGSHFDPEVVDVFVSLAHPVGGTAA